MKNVNGTLISEKQITLDNNSGRDLLVKGPQGVFIHQRMFLVNNQLVQAVAVSQSKAESADITHFFNSIKLSRN